MSTLTQTSAGKCLYARFFGPEIFLERGRSLYALLYTFARAGYRITLHPSLGSKPLERYGQMVHEIAGLTIDSRPPANSASVIYLCDHPDKELLDRPWAKRVEVRFDLFSPYWREDPFIMPYSVYPLLLCLDEKQLQDLRASARKMRIFFSGDCEHYRRIWLRYPKVKLPREPIIQAIRKDFSDRLLIEDQAQLATLLTSSYVNKCVVTAHSQVRIDIADWLPTMAKADFFLCPPGIVMPMSHNIIEAMAVGTIPVTNYPEWFDPPLRHGYECLAFDTFEELFGVLQHALAMQAEEIDAMRTRVIEYYERHLRPERFVQRIETQATAYVPILMYSERYVALHAKRLGRHSILMQGTAHPRPRGLARRLAAVYLPNLYAALSNG